MEKSAVVAIRDALLSEENRSMKVAFDNGIVFLTSADMVLWDDDKEIVVGFVADNDTGSYAASKPIRIIGTTYEHIQFIMSNTNVDYLQTALDSLSNSITIDEENKAKIIEWFTKLYDYRRDLSHRNYDPIDLKRGAEQVKLKEE